MANSQNTGEPLQPCSKYLGEGRRETRNPRATLPFNSLSDSKRSRFSRSRRVPSKYTSKYATEQFSTVENIFADPEEANVSSRKISVQTQTDKADITVTNPPSSGSNQPKTKSLSADDFMSNTVDVACASQQQLDLSLHSGESHCSGACAMIPKDIQPLIKQAYEDTDFSEVDPDPVCLPMLGDDGILRRDYPTK